MNQYYSRQETPLKFHKFFWYVSLPIGFLAAIGRMFSEISDILFFNWLYAVDIAYYIIALSLMLICFIGFFEWKSYAWYSVIIYLCVAVAYNLFAVIMYAVYMPQESGTAIGQLLGVSIYAILVGIYYKKRRPLFFPNAAQINTIENSCQIHHYENNMLYANGPLRVRYCGKCGYELLEGSGYCSRCGAPVTRERYI